jgi:FHS family L-fucose permease-like MFS transporter
MGLANVPTSNVAATGNQRYTSALAVLTSLFFMWGLLTCLNDIIIPHLKAVFDLNYAQAMLVNTAFFIAYFIVSLPSGKIVERFGYKNGIIVGLLTAATGCAIFFPAAGLQSYPLFLVALFILASGITLLQVAANPYVAVLGNPKTASSRLTLTQAFNSLGTTIAGPLGSWLILALPVKAADELKAMTASQVDAYHVASAASVQKPYLALTAVLVLIAVVIAVIKLPKIEAPAAEGASAGDGKSDSAWKHRHLVLGAVGIFVYVGGEVAIGSFLINYISQPSIGAMSVADAGTYLTFYWGGAMVGRFIGSFVMQYVKPARVLTTHAVAVMFLVVVAMVTTGHVSMWAILAVGLFNSIMFPTIFTLAIDGLGKHTGQGSSILCMAIVGGALVSPLQGWLADGIGIQHAFIVPFLCYAYIAYYGLRGHALSVRESAPAKGMAEAA